MSVPPHPEPEELRISTKLYYGLGSVAEGTKNTAFNVFLLFYYNQVLGLSGTLSGAAIFVALCVDAITDPLMGSISDNFHSRWGRRHPFMYTSALPMAACFYLLFNPYLLFSPATLGETGLFLWLCFLAVGVRVSMTLYSIPSNSMVPELTSHYDERTTLVSYRFLFGWFGGLTASLLGYWYFFAPSAEFPNGQLNAEAYGTFSLVGAAMIFFAILTCAGGTHRLIPRLKPPPAKTPLTLQRFSGELRDVFGNRSYLMLVGASLFAAVAGGFQEVVGLYMNTYFWEFTTAQMGFLGLLLFISVIIAFAFTRRLTERFDKKRAVLGLAGFAILFGPLLIYLRLLDLMPANGNPVLFFIIGVHVVILVAASVAIGITTASMIGDVVDENELVTGKRQEGMFVSAIAFTAKATSGIGGFVAGVALDIIDFPTMADPATIAPDKVFNLGLAVGPGMMVLYLVTLIFLSRYRITRERHGEVLAELARRSGRLAGEAGE
jgi:Na+/melibiose symporter-like transporter